MTRPSAPPSSGKLSAGLAAALATALLGSAALLPAPARAEGRKRSIGIFLPATLDDRDQQFKFGEAVAAALTKSLDGPVGARSFGRYEDFAAAIADGSLDAVLSEAYILAEAKGRFTPVAVALVGGEPLQAWAVVAAQPTSAGQMAGQRLALVKGAGAEAQFLANAIFGGELPGGHFKVVPVPTLESALKAVAARTADGALVPLALAPHDLSIVYKSGRIEGALLAVVKGAPADYTGALAELPAFGRISKFAPATGDELASMKRRMEHGPTRHPPFKVDSPLFRLDPTGFELLKTAAPVPPPLGDLVEVSKELPDD